MHIVHASMTRFQSREREGEEGKKKKISAKRAGERIFWPCLCPIKKTKKKKTNFSLRKQAYGFVRFLLFFPLFLFLSNVIHFFSPPFLFSLFFLFFFLFFFFFFLFVTQRVEFNGVRGGRPHRVERDLANELESIFEQSRRQPGEDPKIWFRLLLRLVESSCAEFRGPGNHLPNTWQDCSGQRFHRL